MRQRQAGLAGLLLVMSATWASGAALRTPAAKAHQPVPMALPPVKRLDVRQVMEKPTIFAQGPTETFLCQPEHYQFFLDHPDKAVTAWRRLGAKCVSIHDRGNGHFRWSDELGSEVAWETVYQDANQRVWYAEGKVRPAPLLPLVPVRVVIILNHQIINNLDNGTLMQHQANVFLFTDSKTTLLITRLVGPSAQRIAEQGLGQFQLFFSGLCWYLHRHPEQEGKLIGEENQGKGR